MCVYVCARARVRACVRGCERGEGENCGLSLHFTDLKTLAVICSLLYLAHSFLDSVSRRCTLYEIICMYDVEDMSGKYSCDVAVQEKVSVR